MPNPTQTIPGYQIIRKLGSGGMAVVFLAQDTKNRRQVALKILYPKTIKNQTLLARFIREAQLLIKFQHPHIVKGYHSGNFKGLYFLAMEYIEGASAQSLIDRQDVVLEDSALKIIIQTAEALDYIEQKGILHRDIKPDNLLLTSNNIVKLCDLGFAQPLRAATGPSSEITSGTPQYMSPEQAKGQMDLDIRSDIYSLGATLYQLVTGKLPFQGTDNLEVMAKQVLDDLQSDEIKNRRLSPLTLYFIEKMMAKEKEIRYQNPREVIEDIQSQVEGFKSLEYQTKTKKLPGRPQTKPLVRGRLGKILTSVQSKKAKKKK